MNGMTTNKLFSLYSLPFSLALRWDELDLYERRLVRYMYVGTPDPSPFLHGFETSTEMRHRATTDRFERVGAETADLDRVLILEPDSWR